MDPTMHERLRATWSILLAAGKDFVDDEATTRAAALAFYTALSFAPLLLITLWVTSLVGQGSQDVMVEQVRGVMGNSAGQAVTDVIEHTERVPTLGTVSGVISLVVLVFSASGVFAQLQQTLNRVWDVKAKSGRGIASFVRTRLLSMAMLGAVAFLLLVSLSVSTVLAFVMSHLGPLVALASFSTNVVVFSVAFALIYKVVPDCDVRLRDALIGGILTAVLFAVGKEAIGLYLARSSVGSAYGAAGSLLVLLVWVYFSGIVVLFGAELTQAYAVRYGAGIRPNEHAVALHRKHPPGGRPGSDARAA